MHRRLGPLLALVLTLGCIETTSFRSVPSGAAISVNGQPIGVSPATFQVPSTRLSANTAFQYRVEREGYRPAEGEFRSLTSSGRVVASVFTFGVMSIFRGTQILPDAIDVELQPLWASREPRPAQSVAVRLQRLEELFEQGSITDEEYRRERERILHEL